MRAVGAGVVDEEDFRVFLEHGLQAEIDAEFAAGGHVSSDVFATNRRNDGCCRVFGMECERRLATPHDREARMHVLWSLCGKFRQMLAKLLVQ